jgi:phage-related protein
MALPTFPDFPPLLDSTQDSVEVRTDLATFGDGARQETEAGLNSEVTNGGWSWHLSKTDIDTIVAFLRTNGVSGFEFTLPTSGQTVNFKCTRRTRKEITPESDRLDCTFEQIFVP